VVCSHDAARGGKNRGGRFAGEPDCPGGDSLSKPWQFDSDLPTGSTPVDTTTASTNAIPYGKFKSQGLMA
jgi:hypothetical protein